MRQIVGVLLLFLLFAAVVPAEAKAPIRIGVSLSMSGKYAEMGDMGAKAYRLWESDVNSRGGILGRKVILTIDDDKSDPALAKEIYRRMIEQDKMDLVLGPYSSAITEAVLSVTEKHGYPLLVSGGSADHMWQQGYKNLFGVFITSKKYTISFLETLVGNGFHKIAIIFADDAFSKTIAANTKEWANRFELETVAYEGFKKENPDLSEFVIRARAAGAEAVIICGHLEESVSGQRALKALGWSPRAYYATVGPALQAFHDTLKSDAEFTFTTSQWEPNSKFPGSKEFAAAFTQAYGHTPSYHAAGPYAAGQILEAAARKSGSIDRAKLSKALYALDTITIMGRYGVDRTGKQIRQFAMTVQWQNGRKEIVAPKEVTTARPIWK